MDCITFPISNDLYFNMSWIFDKFLEIDDIITKTIKCFLFCNLH